MLVHWIWLATRPGLQDREKLAVLERFSQPEAAFYATEQELRALETVSSNGVQALLDKDLTEARQIMDRCADARISVCTFRDGGYPSRLKHIPDPPLVLYYRGVLPEWDAMPVIGVVGTRKYSAYGLNTAHRIGFQIAKCGAVVVSGLAKGIDSAAMSGALTGGGTVVGVLGCGVDVVYPASNRELYQDTQQQGCLISEYPPGTPPLKWNFPKRNRIISGLSCGVLVVEAPEGSGALITARQAAEQGRDVFAVPGNVDLPSFAGSNALLRDGAIMAGCGWDVVGEYQAQYPDKVHQDTSVYQEMERPVAKVAQKTDSPVKNQTFDRKKEKITIDKAHSCAYSDVVSAYTPATPEEKLLLECLGTATWLVDDLIGQTGLPAGKVLGMLTMLEIKGIVARLPGKQVKRKN